MESVLREADPTVWDRAALGRLIDNQHRGYNNHQRIFALTIFELWRRTYGVSLPD
jgi:hypothetical protein